MRRTVLTLGGTVAGMAALLTVKFQPGPSVPLAAGATAPKSVGATEPSAAAKPAAKPGGTRQAATTRVFTGSVASTAYGPMQVRITVTGGKLTKVTALQLPNDNSRDQEIAGFAVPQLTQEALAAQSAHVDSVSGATYTSEGYTQSLQSALDKAGL